MNSASLPATATQTGLHPAARINGPAVPLSIAEMAVTAGATAIAATLAWALVAGLGFKLPLFAFVPAVMVSAWFGGLWPGVASTVLSAGLVAYFWLPPVHSMRVSNLEDMLGLFAFACIGVIISLVNESALRGKARELVARQQAERAEAIRRGAQADAERVTDELAAQLADARQLVDLSARLLKPADLPSMLRQIVESCVGLVGADKGHVLRYDPPSGPLRMAAQVGFHADVERLNGMPGGPSIYEVAVRRRERVIVEDAFRESAYAPLAPVYAAQGFVAAHCTPLLSKGIAVGVLSMHFRGPHRPTDRELTLLDLHARLAERVIERTRTEDAARDLADQR